jgi:heme exporter protein A
MLTATNLTCVRGDRRLFAGLGFALEPGSWIHVTGENGSGKTSLLRMLVGLAQPEVGEICWQGVAIERLGDDYRKDVTYLAHHNALKEELTAQENLCMGAALTGRVVDRAHADTLLHQIGLEGREEAPVRFLSQGQQRRLALARLLWSKTPLWILDEPFVALDGAAVTWLATTLAAHLAAGGMAILTSHQEVTITGCAAQTLHIGA